MEPVAGKRRFKNNVLNGGQFGKSPPLVIDEVGIEQERIQEPIKKSPSSVDEKDVPRILYQTKNAKDRFQKDRLSKETENKPESIKNNPALLRNLKEKERRELAKSKEKLEKRERPRAEKDSAENVNQISRLIAQKTASRLAPPLAVAEDSL